MRELKVQIGNSGLGDYFRVADHSWTKCRG